jgi:dihydropteroate synthase
MNPRPQFEIEVAGRRVRLGERTLLMGVLNVTPDSFSDGGLYFAPERAVRRGAELARQGADWIDVGGESTRPGSQRTSAEEELRRVLPVIRGLRRRLGSVPISIDTTKAEVAEQALRAGASILNDVSGLRFDPRLAEVARRRRVPLILMHLRGRPETMQQKPFARDIWRSLIEGLGTSLQRVLAAGVRRWQIILDPGLGFGKSRRQNYEILAGLERLRRFHLPILVGSSRKSFVQAIVAGEGLVPSPGRQRRSAYWPIAGARCDASRQVGSRVATGTPGSALGAGNRPGSRSERAALAASLPLAIGDAAAVVAAILGGAHIVRVHDPGAVLPAVRIADAILAARR